MVKRKSQDYYNYNFRSGQFTRGELEALYKNMARTANQRLARLEKADRAFWAYDKATLFTQRAYGTNRFKTSASNMTDKGLIRVLEEMRTFLGSKTSTVSGSKNVDRKILKKFREKKVDIKDPKEFFQFLNSEQFRKLSGKKLSSSVLIDYYVRSSEQGDNLETIKDELEDFRTGKIEGADVLFERKGMTILDVKDLRRKSK